MSNINISNPTDTFLSLSIDLSLFMTYIFFCHPRTRNVHLLKLLWHTTQFLFEAGWDLYNGVWNVCGACDEQIKIHISSPFLPHKPLYLDVANDLRNINTWIKLSLTVLDQVLCFTFSTSGDLTLHNLRQSEAYGQCWEETNYLFITLACFDIKTVY